MMRLPPVQVPRPIAIAEAIFTQSGPPQQAIILLLVGLHVGAELLDRRRVAARGERVDHRLHGRRRRDEMLRHLVRPLCRVAHFVQPHALRRRLDVIHDVVEPGRDPVDVAAVDGRDERAVQHLQRALADLVGLVLDLPDAPGLLLGGCRRLREVAQQVRPLDATRGMLGEEIEELGSLRKQSAELGRSSPEVAVRVVSPSAHARRAIAVRVGWVLKR